MTLLKTILCYWAIVVVIYLCSFFVTIYIHDNVYDRQPLFLCGYAIPIEHVLFFIIFSVQLYVINYAYFRFYKFSVSELLLSVAITLILSYSTIGYGNTRPALYMIGYFMQAIIFRLIISNKTPYARN
jgi:hypothetical protein